MTETTASDLIGASWSDPKLAPDQFLYQRMGPWPQPSPSYPMEQAPEVLDIPAVEALLWNEEIGSRYLEDLVGYPPMAAAKALLDGEQAIPTDAEFVNMMTNSVYLRFLKNTQGNTWVSSFQAMELISKSTLPGTYCAPVSCTFERTGVTFSCVNICFLYPDVPHLIVTPQDNAWKLAKVYALQGAAYHALFVQHTALHFPMDSVNAITKSAVPQNHPLFQLLYPHTSYTLALDNAVLEGQQTVVNNDAPGTWFDPLTANGYDIKRLFGVGYTGLPPAKYGKFYPQYNYMDPWMPVDSAFGKCLNLYFQPFLTFCTTVATAILKADANDTYVKRWAAAINQNIYGFPDVDEIFSGGRLAKALAIYMWDVTVAHSADHSSFANDIAPKTVGPDGTPLVAWKFLRIRVVPPTKSTDGVGINAVKDVCLPDDLYRAEMAQQMFFESWTIKPNLNDTHYAFLTDEFWVAQEKFHADLTETSVQVAKIMPNFPPLTPPNEKSYGLTISASIQY